MTETHLDVLDKIKSKIQALHHENEQDQIKLQKLNVDYENAVISFESEKIDSIYKEMEQIKSNIANRSKQINILSSKDNPARKEAIENHLAAVYQEAKVIEKKAKGFKKELSAARDNYIQLLAQAIELNGKYNDALRNHHKESVRLGVIPSSYFKEENAIRITDFYITENIQKKGAN